MVEVAGSVAGAYAGKFFSDHGATVLRIEPLAGDPLRQRGTPVANYGSLFAYLNTGKRSLKLDSAGEAFLPQLRDLCANADVLIESSAPEPLRPHSADFDLPGLVKVYISPFGLSGPYAGFAATDFQDFAIGGGMFITGDPDRPPLQGPPHQSEFSAGIHGFIGAMAALLAREQDGLGQVVEVSHFEVMASLDQYTIQMWTHSRHIEHRVGNATPGPWHPNIHLRCKDGDISITAGGRDRRTRMVDVIGLSELLEDPRFSTEGALMAHRAAFDAAIAPWFLDRTVHEVVDLMQAIRVPAAPVRGILDVLDYEHLRERDYWRSVDLGGQKIRMPRGPFVIEGHSSRLEPPLGLGDATDADLKVFTEPRPKERIRGSRPQTGPLDGLRVLDLGAGWAGPFVGRMLGDLGADVIRVEAPWARGPKQVSREHAQQIHMYPDDDPGERPWNRQGMNNLWGRNRRTVSLRLDTPEGHLLLEQLIARADVLLENFTPRVMPNFGLDYPRLKELNPSLIYLHLPGFGTAGPNAHYASLGPMIEAAAGICSLMGYPDRGRQRQGSAFPDAISGMSGVAGVLIALWDRLADPEKKARDVEGAQLESTICFAGEALIDAQLTHREPALRGNRSGLYAPQGCYAARGEERWVAVTVLSDEGWAALCRALDLPHEWARLTLAERQSEHEQLDGALSRWISGREMTEVVQTLQTCGVAASGVFNGRDLIEDPHLADRRFFVTLSQGDTGPLPFAGCPIRLSRTPATYRIPSPGLGQFNDEVLAELGLDVDRIGQLRRLQVVADEPMHNRIAEVERTSV